MTFGSSSSGDNGSNVAESAACLVVGSQPPHVITAASPEWLRLAGFADGEVCGRPAVLLQGSGTCQMTSGALWTAVQVRAMHRTRPRA